MTRVRNTHGAPCCGLAPGAVGDVDESNAGVASAIAGRLLVRVEETSADGARLSADADVSSARIAELEAEVARLKADLETATAPSASAPRSEVSEPVEPTGRTGRTTRNSG